MDSFLMYDASTGQIEWRRQTKTIFAPFIAGTTELQSGTHTGFEIDLGGELAYCEIDVPDDFGVLLTAEVAWICLAATLNMAFQVDANFGGHDAALAGETGTYDVTFDGTPTINDLYKHDIMEALADIEAGDILGLTVTFDTNTDGIFLYVKLTYEVSVE